MGNRSMNNQLKEVLAHPAIGRPLRKALWIPLRATNILQKALTTLFWKQPYVKKLMFLGDVSSFDKIYNYLRGLKNAVTYLPYQPKFSVIIPMYKVKPAYLKDTLLSVAYQTYDNWEVCIVDDCSGMPELAGIIEEFGKAFQNGGGQSNRSSSFVTGWVKIRVAE